MIDLGRLTGYSPTSSADHAEASCISAPDTSSSESGVEAVIKGVVDAFVKAFTTGDTQALESVIEQIAQMMMQAKGGTDGFDSGGPTAGPQPQAQGDGFQSHGSGRPMGQPCVSSPTPTQPGGNVGASRISQVIDGMNVESNPKYLPRGTPGTAGRTTYCNVFAQDVLKKLGVPAPSGNANGMNKWFNQQGAQHGWKKVSAAEAQQLANSGHPAVASWANPTGSHGHIAMVRAGKLTNGAPTIAQAGGHNYANTNARRGFGKHEPQYFVYEGKTSPQAGALQGQAQGNVGSTPGTSRSAPGAGRNNLEGFRSNQYDPIIKQMSAKYGVPARLIKSVIEQESKFKPGVGSSKGALGLMQLMPGTARELGVTNRTDPRQSIEGGTKYLARMMKMFKGNIPLALAGYNAGPGKVLKAHGVPRIAETQAYVRNITANYYR